jgi:hypothetical protein
VSLVSRSFASRWVLIQGLSREKVWEFEGPEFRWPKSPGLPIAD